MGRVGLSLQKGDRGKPAMAGGLGIKTMKRKYKSTNLRLCNPKPPRAWRSKYILRRPIFHQLHSSWSSTTGRTAPPPISTRNANVGEEPIDFRGRREGQMWKMPIVQARLSGDFTKPEQMTGRPISKMKLEDIEGWCDCEESGEACGMETSV